MTLDRNLCVLRGASAVINCQYDYPSHHVFTEVVWWKHQQMARYWRRVPFDSRSQHYRYLGDYISGNCSLQINDVQDADTGNYVFIFRTVFQQQTSEISTLSVKGNDRNKPASKCLKHLSSFALFPVVQS